MLKPLVRNLGLNKNNFIKHVQSLLINSGSKQKIKHGYDRIYDMFDLSIILRSRVLEIHEWSFHNISLNNNDKQAAADLVLPQPVSLCLYSFQMIKECLSCTVYWDYNFFYIGRPIPIVNGSSRHPLIEFIATS